MYGIVYEKEERPTSHQTMTQLNVKLLNMSMNEYQMLRKKKKKIKYTHAFGRECIERDEQMGMC